MFADCIAFGFPCNSRYRASRFQHRSFHRITTTENDVRMVARVQNAVFITFVHTSIPHPKWHRFGQLHAEHALWALTCFKFRILRGPLKPVKHVGPHDFATSDGLEISACLVHGLSAKIPTLLFSKPIILAN